MPSLTETSAASTETIGGHSPIEQLETRPAEQPQPDQPVLWVPNWYESSAISVASAEALGARIARLPKHEFGGIVKQGSRGPWAQVMRENKKRLLLELHPHRYGGSDGLDGTMLFDRVLNITAAQAGRLAWNWVTRSDLPHGFVYEPRIVTPRSSFDHAL